MAGIKAVQNSVAGLPEGRRSFPEVSAAEVNALRDVAAAVTTLKDAARQVITTATAAIDVPRPAQEAAARPVAATAPPEADVLRQDVDAAAILAGAAESLLDHTGDRQDASR